MRSREPSPFLVSVLLLLFLGAGPALGAPQEAAAEPELGARIETLRRKIQDREKRAANLAGEDAEINADQLRLRTEELGSALEELVGRVKDGTATPEETALAATVVQEMGGKLQAGYERIDGQLAALRVERETAEDKSAVDDEINELEARQSDILAGIATSLELKEALGIESDRTWLVDELQRRGTDDAARLQLRQTKVDALAARVKAAKDEKKDELSKELAIEQARLDAAVGVLDRTIALMDAQELETSELRQLRLEAKGEVQLEDVDVGVLLGVVRRWGDNLRATLVENGPRWIFKAVLFLGILFVFKILANLTRGVVRKAVSSSRLKFSSLLREFFVGLAGKAVLLVGLLIALSQLGFQLGPILAGLGIAGFVLGFALQDTLSNFASGMMILVYRPFDVGNYVSVAGVAGTVSEMSLVSTTILTPDNQNLIVPNSKIWGDVITNVTARSTRRVDLTFGISYADDISKAEGILREILTSHDKVLKDPEPVVKLHKLNDSSVDFVVRPWVNTSDYWGVYWDVTRAVKERFDAADISIPFPQRDIHVYQESNGEPEGSAKRERAVQRA